MKMKDMTSIREYGNHKEEVSILLSMLHVCTHRKDLCEGTKVHTEILRKGLLEKSFHLGSCLISMYAKCGAFLKAQRVFDELPRRNEASWNALISGYGHHEQSKEAMDCFERMCIEGFLPQPITFTCLLKSGNDDIEKGKKIHGEVARLGFVEKDIQLGNALIGMYARCGDLRKAREVMEKLPSRDEVSWNTLISAYSWQGQGETALHCFEEMKRDGFSPNIITFVSILKTCSSIGDINTGRQIHHEITGKGYLEKTTTLGNALIDMYAICGALYKAREVLEELHVRDVVTWTGLISGYIHYGQGEEALECFTRMRTENLSPNVITFTCILKACGAISAIGKGKQVHSELLSNGLLVAKGDIVLTTALMNMYLKCGYLSKAEKLSLEHLPVRDVTYWNALISGYAQHDQAEEALRCFEQMQHEGLSPNTITFVSLLNACGIIGAIEKGKEAHNEIICKGCFCGTCIETCIKLGTTLVDLYVKCGLLLEARRVHDELPIRDVVTWNAIISGYVQQGRGEEALTCFTCMQEEGFSPDVITLTCIVKACGSTGAIEKGKEIHDDINSKGLLGKHIVLGNALVDMYAKCGALAKAKNVINDLPSRDIVSWSTLISGYAQQGQGQDALNCFELMKCDGVSPNGITFLSVLNACSHSGLVDQGQMHFENMSQKYGITPDIDHLTCMIDLFGRAGHFDKAVGMLKKMPSLNYPPIWRSLLGACRKWANVKLGRLAFDELVQLDRDNPAIYICMANIYATAGMKDASEKIEAMRTANKCCLGER